MGLSKESMGLHAAQCAQTKCARENGDIVVALAGNPNVGKSTVFNALTGMKQHTGNWPGKTILNAQGQCSYGGKQFLMVDIPGCYSLNCHSMEEEVAKAFLVSGQADVVVVVCAATCLERNLILALQIMELFNQVVLCVNLMDEAQKNHMVLDLKELQRRLGIPVVATSARSKKGLENLCEAIKGQSGQAKKCTQKRQINKELVISEKKDTEYYVNKSEKICSGIVKYQNQNYERQDRRRDRILTGKYTGFPIMFLLLLLLFWLTISGANYISAYLQQLFFDLEGLLYKGLNTIRLPWILVDIIVNGIFRVAAWVVSVMLPPMAIFFPLFTLLEDSGYLPRIAFNLDRCFQKCHTCGKQSLCMCMGLGCNAAGVVGCRIIDSARERMIAIITNSFVPCNGRFPMLILIITMFFGGKGAITAAVFLAGAIVLSVCLTFLVSAFLSKTVLKGMPSSFVLELPPYRRPQIGMVLVRSLLDRTLFVLGRAIVAAAPAGAIIWIMANVSVGGGTLLSHCASFLDPVGRLLGMDGVILFAFILGFPANELVIPIIMMTYMAAGSLSEAGNVFFLKELLLENGWTWVTAVCTMLFCLFHWPCATTCMTIHKETGSLKWTLLSIALPTAVGAGICALFHAAALLLGF